MDPHGPVQLACVLVVDRRGWLLLQERDEHAPRAPGQWGLVGGHVEQGESVLEAARRELAEETGIRVEAEQLRLWRTAEHHYPDEVRARRYGLFAVRLDVTDADVVVGEGRRIVLVDPLRVPRLALGGSAAHFVPAFLTSTTYAELAAPPGPPLSRPRAPG